MPLAPSNLIRSWERSPDPDQHAALLALGRESWERRRIATAAIEQGWSPKSLREAMQEAWGPPSRFRGYHRARIMEVIRNSPLGSDDSFRYEELFR